MEHYETYLILFMAGIIVGGYTSLTMGTGARRRTDWKYPASNWPDAYTSSSQNASGFWITVLIGVLLLILAVVWAEKLS